MLILSVFQSITHSFSHSAWVLILQENRHFCGKEEKMIVCVYVNLMTQTRCLCDVTQSSRTATKWTFWSSELNFVPVCSCELCARREVLSVVRILRFCQILLHWVQWKLYIQVWILPPRCSLLSSLCVSKLSVPSRPLRLNKAAVGLNGCLAVETGLSSTAEPLDQLSLPSALFLKSLTGQHLRAATFFKPPVFLSAVPAHKHWVYRPHTPIGCTEGFITEKQEAQRGRVL